MALRTTLNKGLTHLLVITLSGLLSLPASLMINVPGASAATITVTNTNDAGLGSLRQAIIDSNGSAGVLDTINFNLSGTITLATDLEVIFDPVIIDGSTAPDNLVGADIVLSAVGRAYCIQFNGGAGSVIKGIGCTGAANGLIIGPNLSGMTVGGTGARDINEWNNCTSAGIQIDGGDNVTLIQNNIGLLGGNQGSGLDIKNTATGIIVGGLLASQRNIIVNSTLNGINIQSASVTVSGNWIGTGTGSNDLGNAQNGIFIGTSVTNTTIGGLDGTAGNIISGNNQNGISISQSPGIFVKNNFIGTTSAGTAALPNSQNGILIQSDNNVIGGTSGVNVISGNTINGIRLAGDVTSANGNTIQLNKIGLDKNGTAALPNGQAGLKIHAGSVLNTIIGGTSLGNTISGNTGGGIAINTVSSTGTTIYGNTIGLGSDNTTAIANAQGGIAVKGDNTIIGDATIDARRNIIASNGGPGIYINGADSVSVKNNYIGVAGDGVTQRTNTDHAINIDATAASSLIGDTIVGGPNVIAAANGKSCVNIDTSAGDFNSARKNSCLGGTHITLTPPANESIATPTISIANTSYSSGTTIANGTVDLYSDASFLATVTADGTGAWERHGSGTLNQKLYAAVTNGNKSTSGMSAGTNIDSDSTAPTIPTVSSPANNSYTATTTINLTGTKEANTSIWIDGVQVVANDGLTTWTVNNHPVIEGQNNLLIVAKDSTPNSSSTLTHTIHRDTVIPAAPTLNYPSTSTQTVIITGSGTEAGASVIINSVVYTTVDNLGNFSAQVSLQPEANSLSLVVRDSALNSSSAVLFTITNTAGGGSSGGSNGASSSNSNSSSNIVGDTEDEDQNAMAGEGEEDPVVVVEPGTTNTETDSNDQVPETDGSNTETGSTTDTPAGSTSETNSSTSNTSVKNPPVKGSFYSGIYQYVEPIKIKTVRETLATKPLLPPKFNEKVLNAKLFENKNAQGVPQILIDLKGKGKELTDTRDSDNDGAYDWEEVLGGSNPEVIDTDRDGRTDGEELLVDETNPDNWDSDGDHIADANDVTPNDFTPAAVTAQEIADYIEEVTLTEPVGQADSDGDGLSDLGEIYGGTDPKDADSDNDGLNDGYEVLSLGSDPTTSTPESAVESISIVNVNGGGGTFESGTQLYVGHVGTSGGSNSEITISAYEVTDDGGTILLGQTTTDENGSYVLLTSTEVPAGNHTIFLATGSSLDSLTDISQPIEVTVVDYVKKPQFAGLGLSDGAYIDDPRPTLSLNASDVMVVVLWQSTVNGLTLIADASDQTLNARPVENLELGEHVVTWYAEDLKTGNKSAPTQIAFNVTNTAFASGETSESPWVIALGSIAILASLTALALFYRNRKLEA